MVGEGGTLPLPWLEATLRDTLATRRAHALLLLGPSGVGQFELDNRAGVAVRGRGTGDGAALRSLRELPAGPGALAP